MKLTDLGMLGRSIYSDGGCVCWFDTQAGELAGITDLSDDAPNPYESCPHMVKLPFRSRHPLCHAYTKKLLEEVPPRKRSLFIASPA